MPTPYVSHDRRRQTRLSETLPERYSQVRAFSEALCEPLAPEDCVIQSMPDASPTRWHLAHTTWFFETFVLTQAMPDYELFHPAYAYLFNSYYNSVGKQFTRPHRGLISRPTLRETLDYRQSVDNEMQKLLDDVDPENDLLPVVEIGLHHEQQHQELILTDIKHVLSCNPLYPAYRDLPKVQPQQAPPSRWTRFEEGLYWMGHNGEGFAFDNESPRHRVFVESFQLASRLVTNGEYVEFIEDGGYGRPEFWLSEGWQHVCTQGWKAPLYWVKRPDGWRQFTLAGLQPLEPPEPVCHVSYFEADAFARWAGVRLPTEAEWELAAAEKAIEGNFVEDEVFRPLTAAGNHSNALPTQMFGDLWEWTASSYTPYPGYAALAGALGEYNGKFMCNQYVLRGGSCATSQSHIRHTYRNFFPPDARWQLTGIRLAR